MKSIHESQQNLSLGIRMATLSYSFLFFILLFVVADTRGAYGDSICETTSCENSEVSIRFPFWLRESNQSRWCGYPGFELRCNKKNQPLITLPESGDFIVKLISHRNQMVWINDQDQCLSRGIMLNHGLSLSGSPFRLGDAYTLANYSFFSCPSNAIFAYMPEAISCLSTTIKNVNYSVLAVLSNSNHQFPSCHLISSALVPVLRVHGPFLTNYDVDIQLQWEDPYCGECEERGGWCGLLGNSTLQVACYDLPPQEGQGIPRKVMYGLTIGLGIPGLLVTIGLACCFYSRKRMNDQLRQARTEFSTLNIPQHSPAIVMGLDGASIEKYPTTQLGESGRLPKPNDNICSICLSEYQPKETLRTIPECDHYFHADCIDGWLKMNAACPLCRNLPGTGRSSSSFSSLPLSPTSS